MKESKKKNFLANYSFALVIAFVAVIIRIVSLYDTGMASMHFIFSILGIIAYTSISIFGLALILKLILDRNMVQPGFNDLSNKVAFSLIPILILQPLTSLFFSINGHWLFYFLPGFVVLVILINASFKLSIRKSLFIAGFSFFAYFVLMTIFYGVPI